MRRLNVFVDDNHVWLDDAHPHWAKRNMGADGSDLTVAFLSMNRSALSIRLVRSLMAHVPTFAGRILVADNGSDAGELEALERFLVDECPFPFDVLRFGTNHGVGGGRNRAFEAVKTGWILSLDNDIFLTDNPFPALSRDLATLGCHFLSVPLVNPDRRTFYSFGGHLHPTLIDRDRPFLGTACMLPPGAELQRAAEVTDEQGFLCSFLFGGASVVKRDSFLTAGGFDDAMVVGFEDIEFSLRLFRIGLKVGSSAVSCFVHDHPPAAAPSDREYERTRYSRRLLKDAADHFEAKHGFRVWSEGVDTWLADREKHQGIAADAAEPPFGASAVVEGSRKPRIALAVDRADWAYANIARQLEKHLSDRYDIEILATVSLNELEAARRAEAGVVGSFSAGDPRGFAQILIRAPEFDLVHVFWRPMLTALSPRSFYGDETRLYAERLGLTWEEFRERFVDRTTFTTSVYDHLFADGEEAAIMAPALNEVASAYTVSSSRLRRIYDDHPLFAPPTATIPDGVDPDLFFPKNLERFDTVGGREVVVGWVGNSRWAGDGDSKGVETILKPAIAALQTEGLRIRVDFADRSAGFVPHDRMVDYYAGVDVLVCTSAIEGTPNPVLEALACGVPIISTDVGIVPDALGPTGRRFILRERSVEALKEALRKLVAHPDLFRALSTENLAQATDWSWARQAEAFDGFFASVLAQRDLPTEPRTKLCMLPFTTPSQEPDGSIRLCSASSIFAYRDETNMGNSRQEGLEAVWRGDKYRNVRRRLLLGGDDLTPYCAACEYRHDGPAWLLQLHTSLHAFHNGVRDAEVLGLIGARLDRYDEYVRGAKEAGLAPHPRPDLAGLRRPKRVVAPEALLDGKAMPIYVDLNTLNRCNVSCVMCPPAIKYDRGEERDDYYRLTIDEFRRLSDGVNLKSAHFVGAYAEPLLNKDIFELVRTAHDLGAFTAITTNALPLVPPFAKKLIDAGLDMMSISLHGATKKTAESIMLKSNFERVLGNIRVLQKLKAEAGTAKPELYFNFVSQLGNVHEMGDFVDMAADLGVKHVQIIHLIDGDEAVDRTSNLVRHPDLLVPNVRDALRRGEASGVNVIVSPAYADLLRAAADADMSALRKEAA